MGCVKQVVYIREEGADKQDGYYWVRVKLVTPKEGRKQKKWRKLRERNEKARIERLRELQKPISFIADDPEEPQNDSALS